MTIAYFYITVIIGRPARSPPLYTAAAAAAAATADDDGGDGGAIHCSRRVNRITVACMPLLCQSTTMAAPVEAMRPLYRCVQRPAVVSISRCPRTIYETAQKRRSHAKRWLSDHDFYGRALLVVTSTLRVCLSFAALVAHALSFMHT